jgi:hypothetical protein
MNVDDAVDALINVATAIFPKGPQEVANPEVNSEKLKEAIEDVLQTRGLAVNTNARTWQFTDGMQGVSISL